MEDSNTRELTKVESSIVAMSEMSEADLMTKEAVDAIVAAAVQIAEDKKAAAEQDKKVKDEFKRMCSRYMDEGVSVTCYSYDSGMKLTLTPKGGGAELDEGKLLESIYEMFGEQVGDKGGRAWAAYCAISDPMDAPRVINPDKLAAELVRASRIANGEEEGTPNVTEQIVKRATEMKRPVYAAGCSKMSKAELSAHDRGELTEIMVVK